MHIVITGSSRGIGKELTNLFLDNNHKVTAISRSTSYLKDIKVRKNIHAIQVDLSNPENINNTIARDITERFGKVDILINNAGKLINKPFIETNYQDAELIFRTNYMAPALIIKNLFDYFNTRTHIVNISSMGGFQGSAKFPGLSHYSASKAALSALTEVLAEEFKNTETAINCLALGAVQTEMLAEAFPGYNAPIKAKEMAAYIYDFAVNGQKYFNGKVIPVSLSTP